MMMVCHGGMCGIGWWDVWCDVGWNGAVRSVAFCVLRAHLRTPACACGHLRTKCVRFSPTGRQWAAASTEVPHLSLSLSLPRSALSPLSLPLSLPPSLPLSLSLPLYPSLSLPLPLPLPFPPSPLLFCACASVRVFSVLCTALLRGRACEVFSPFFRLSLSFLMCRVVVSCHVLSCHVVSCHVVLCRVVYVVLCRAVSCRVVFVLLRGC